VYGCLDNSLIYTDSNSHKDILIGKHDAAIRVVGTIKSKGLIISAGWDKFMKIWSLNAKNYLLSTIPLADKAYAMCATNTNIAIATADKRVQIYDIRKYDKPYYDKLQTNCSQIRSMTFLNNDDTLAVGTTSSRVLIEYITIKKNPYSFICHKKVIDGISTYYPINALATHPKHNTLVTGGSDAQASVWDIESHKKVSNLGFMSSISSLAYSEDGSKLAIACSYNNDNGINEKDGSHKVIIRNMTETEVKLIK